MKNKKGMNRTTRKVLNLLNQLTKEVGAYAINSSWEYKSKICLLCEEDKLMNFLDKNNLYFNTEYLRSPAYENEFMILYC